MATPKLALIPTGYKAGKLYSVLPESGVGDFTVVRATEATRVNEAGLIETMGANVPRLDYSDGGCPVLLTESQSTNLITYSEDFSQSIWSKAGLTVSSNQIISPDGSLNADEINITAANAHFLFDSISVSALTNYTFTFYAKKGTATDVSYSIYDSSNGADIIASTSYYSQISNTNWTRITVEFTTPSGCTSVRPYPLRDGSSTGTIYIFGAMLEAASYPSSYIKTEGSAVTRNGDQVYGSGDAATFNDSEGVLMAEASALSDDGASRRISISDGSISNRVSIEFDEIANTLKLFIDASVLIANGITLTNLTKIIAKYKSNDYALWVNGFEVAASTTNSNVPSGLDRLSFDGGDGGNDFYGKTSQVQYFNTALTDSELETLTSWTSFIEMAQAQNYNII